MLATALVTIRVAHADVSAENRAAAQALFDQGRSLVKSNNPQEACPKFEESQRLDPGVGTQLNLADCYERVGRTASAWTQYLEVATVARQAGQNERAAHASARAAALSDKLLRMIIIVPKESRIPGLTVQRGDVPVGEAQWGAPMPVDPGVHTVTATAAGHVAWQAKVEIVERGGPTSISIPILKDAPVGAAPAAADAGHEQPRTSTSAQKTGGLVAMGVGVVGLAVGTVFGKIAMSKKSDAGCDQNVCSSDTAASTYQDAQSAGHIATAGFIVGGIGIAAGAVLFLTAPKSVTPPGTASLRASAVILPGGGATTVRILW